MTRATPPGGRVLPFRRRQYVGPRHRRPSWLALLRVLMVMGSAIAVPAGLAAWVWTSPRFDLAEVQIRGAQQVESAWVEQRLRPYLGERLLTLDLHQIERRLSRHRWVAGAALQKVLPDGLRVVLEERRPAAIGRSDQGLVYIASDGVEVSPFDATQGPVDLPLVYGAETRGERAAAISAAREFDRLAPIWGEGLSEIQVLEGGGFRLYTAALESPLLVSERRLEPGLRDLARWLPVLRRRFGAVDSIDLRFDGQIIIQPAASQPLQRERVQGNGQTG